MSPECVGCQDATNSDTLQVVSLFSRHPASYSAFLLEWFHPVHLPFWEWRGRVTHASSVCYCFRQKGELQGQEELSRSGFFNSCMGLELDVMRQ